MIGGTVSGIMTTPPSIGGMMEATEQSNGQLLLFSPLSLSQIPLLLQPQSAGQLVEFSPPPKSQVPFPQLLITRRITSRESEAVVAKIFTEKSKLSKITIVKVL